MYEQLLRGLLHASVVFEISPQNAHQVGVVVSVIVYYRLDGILKIVGDNVLIVDVHQQLIQAHFGIEDLLRAELSFTLQLLNRDCLPVALIEAEYALCCFSDSPEKRTRLWKGNQVEENIRPYDTVIRQKIMIVHTKR